MEMINRILVLLGAIVVNPLLMGRVAYHLFRNARLCLALPAATIVVKRLRWWMLMLPTVIAAAINADSLRQFVNIIGCALAAQVLLLVLYGIYHADKSGDDV